MEMLDEFVYALFDPSLRGKVAKMFAIDFEYNGHKDRMPVELRDMQFRLHKPTPGYVNLELMISSPLGRYFQPIGLFDKNIEVLLLNEHVEAYHRLIGSGKITGKARMVDLQTNAVIAAFSMPTIQLVLQTFQEFQEHGWQSEIRHGHLMPATMRYDKRYICNGFKCELLFSNAGYPQFYLDDDHNLDGAIGAYILEDDGMLSINPTVEFKQLFDNLSKLGLLTAFTKVKY